MSKCLQFAKITIRWCYNGYKKRKRKKKKEKDKREIGKGEYCQPLCLPYAFFAATLRPIVHILQIFFDQIQFDIILVTSSIIIIATIMMAAAIAAARAEARAKARV